MPSYVFTIKATGFIANDEDVEVLRELSKIRSREIMASLLMLPNHERTEKPDIELEFGWSHHRPRPVEWKEAPVAETIDEVLKEEEEKEDPFASIA